MEQHTISIVLPTKDTEPYLDECLDSIVNQTYPHWELLAVNDASSDASFDIIQAYAAKDKRIVAIDNPNPGLLQALRLGYKHATGDLIHRMDSDDKMPIDKLEVMLEALISSGTGSVITGGAEYFIDEGEVGDGFNRYVEWLSEVSRENTHAENIYRESVIASNCWLVHREDFDAIGGFDPDTFPEDYDLCFRFYAGGLKIVGLDKILHLWRDRSDRISRNWDVYKDNRFLDLKTDYFIKVELDSNRPLVVWGAGRNGKDIVRLLQSKEVKNINWVCDNERKIGKDIYDIRMQHYSAIPELKKPQIIIAVASPDDQKEIEAKLTGWELKAGEDYWFFS
mgnify:CR=1 FL=1